MEQQNQLSEADRQRHLALLGRLDRFAEVMDSRFRIPGTRMRFGLDGLIGLIPVAGDTVSAVMSLYLVSESLRIGAPAAVVRRMSMNAGLDFLVGLVPVAGDLLDFAFKANQRNTVLLREYTQARLEPVKADKRRSPLVWVLAGMGLILLALVIVAI